MSRTPPNLLAGGLLAIICWAMAVVPAHAQPSHWEDLMEAGVKAYQEGGYAEAEPLFKRSLAIREKALGPDHPNVATSLENYAALLRKMGRDSEAEKMEARARAIRAKHGP